MMRTQRETSRPVENTDQAIALLISTTDNTAFRKTSQHQEGKHVHRIHLPAPRQTR